MIPTTIRFEPASNGLRVSVENIDNEKPVVLEVVLPIGATMDEVCRRLNTCMGILVTAGGFEIRRAA